MEHVLCCIECRSERVRLQTDKVLETLDDTVDMQCSDDSGDDDLMMVGSDDQFSDLEKEGTTPLIVI